jgi:TetR/AcrR family transcriptional repressor of mexJK operon
VTTSKTVPTAGVEPRGNLSRKEQILAAAHRHFLRDGFHDTSLDDIIKQSGGSKSAIYQYFKNKEELFAAVVEGVVSGIIKRTFDPAEPGEGMRQHLERVAFTYLAGILHPDTLSSLRQSMTFYSAIPTIPGHYYEHGLAVATDKLAALLEETDEIVLPEGESYKDAAGAFLAMIRGNLHLRALLDPNYHPEAHEIRDQCAFGVRHFMHCYGVA